MVSVTVDGQGAPSSPGDGQEWRLPHFDLKNENKYMYRLHTLDIYFWTKEDALHFVSSIRRVLPQHQITVEDEPITTPATHATPLPHADVMSPVVQKLESTVISDPSYQHGQTRDSRTTSTGYSGPPMSALPHSQQASNFSSTSFTPPAPTPPQEQQPASFAPMAYNPAAPAAPEVIKHREKTPPPEDGATNPLVAATAQDHGQSYGAPYQQHQGGFSGPPAAQTPGSYFPGPPGPPTGAPPQVLTQPQAVQSPHAQHFQNSFAAPPTAPINTAVQSPPAYKAEQSPHVPVTQQFASYPGSTGLSSGLTSPAIYSPGFVSPAPPVPGAYNPVSPPPGGFAQYNYGQTSSTQISNTPAMQTQYSVHQQVYRPTEAEAVTKHHDKPKPAQPGIKPPVGKFEQRAGQLEKGMTGLFRKLEKKIG